MSHDAQLGLFLRTLTERIEPERLLERVVGGPADPWQRDLLNPTADTVCVLASRRIGKSTTVGVMAAQELSKPEHQVIILSPSLPQSQLLFAKIERVWALIDLPIQKTRRTMTELHLENGSSVVCVPAGADGESARGYGIKRGVLAYDEAGFIPEAVFSATLPIAEDDARTVMISTPAGRSGKFFDMWSMPDEYPYVQRVRACSLDLARMARTVERARQNLSKHDFEVEHGLRFMGKGTPFFDTEAIERAFTNTPPLELGDIYAGVDY